MFAAKTFERTCSRELQTQSHLALPPWFHVKHPPEQTYAGPARKQPKARIGMRPLKLALPYQRGNEWGDLAAELGPNYGPVDHDPDRGKDPRSAKINVQHAR